MKYPSSLRHGLLTLLLGLSVLPTWAGDDCDAPVSRWQSRDALRQWTSAQGWQLKRLKIDDGCYVVLGTDAQGRRFKAKIDPETFKVLKIKRDEHHRARDRDRDDAGAASPPPSPQPQSSAVPAASPASGAAPRGQVE